MADSKPAALSSAAASEFLSTAERVKPHTKLIALLALGHFVIDVNRGALPAVLPFLGVTALGWVADHWGVPAALWISATMPLLAFILTRFLPAPRETVAA